jgi:hypothetical protein
MKAIHIVCRGFLGLRCIDPKKKMYHSECWAFSERDARSLVGAWIYFHEKKSDSSGFGGVVLGFEPCSRKPAAVAHGYAFIIQARQDGFGEPWRGANHQRAWTSGIIDASLRHEKD